MAIVYNVQIHPIYAGHVNDHKVISEHEFDNFDEAKTFMEQYNEFHWKSAASLPFAIDTETGENQPMNERIKKLSKEQGIVITGFTGKLACRFSDFQSDVEKRLGQPVWTHQFGNEEFAKKIKELYREDFLAMIG